MNIPWHSRSEFQEAAASLARLDRQRGIELAPVRDFALKIGACLRQMDLDLDAVCRITCPGCRDNCCERATIFYDFKDLLCLNFGPGRMPDRQIYKDPESGHCIHLGPGGCALPRVQRPFVCTWYVCPAQKRTATAERLNRMVLEIKSMRNEMEDLFCRITGGVSIRGNPAIWKNYGT